MQLEWGAAANDDGLGFGEQFPAQSADYFMDLGTLSDADTSPALLGSGALVGAGTVEHQAQDAVLDSANPCGPLDPDMFVCP